MVLIGIASGTAAASAPTVIAPVLVWRPVMASDGPSRVPVVSEVIHASAPPSVARRPVRVPTPPVIVRPVAPVVRAKGRPVSGVASRMGPGFGLSYLALPGGPGHRVIICGAASCWKMVSTDAGPDLAMQRAGRVADLNDWVWHHVTGLPLSRGLAKVTIFYLS